MCGFSAMIAMNGARVDPLAVRRMTRVLYHRGPDSRGSHVTDHVAIGFRRLAILDLSPAGDQPLLSDDGQVVLAFNGEIYNHKELRHELQSLGHTFRSTGDTEVLLHAYLQWGRDCLPKLNGMWSFLIHDRRKGTVFGSRDRFGVKPMYRYRKGDHIFISSEIKGIRASGYYESAADWSLISEFLLRGRLDVMSRGAESFYAGIEQVPAGAAFEVDPAGRLTEWRYWSLDDLPPMETDDPSQRFFELFEDAVRLRLRSDVRVGVALSGGLDSTSIAAVMADLRARDDITTIAPPLFAVSYMAPEYDESSYIAKTVRQTGVELHRVHVKPADLWADLERVLWYHDEPVHSPAALVGFHVFRVAAECGVRVMLSGQGADETIGGYPYFFVHHWYTLLRAGKTEECWREINAYCQHSAENATALYRRALRHFAQTEMSRVSAYRHAARWRQARELRGNAWFTDEITQQLQSADARRREDRKLQSALKQAVEVAPLPLYLRVEDRNSMAHSVEARLPFLDYRLVSLVFQLSDRWKLRGPWSKFVLREAVKGKIPEEVRARGDKMGFPVPAAQWFRNELYTPLQDMLASQAVRERGIYNVDAIRKGLDLHRDGWIDASNGLFNVAQLESWFGLQQNEMAIPADDAVPYPAVPSSIEDGETSRPAEPTPLRLERR
ncbi:MAG: asparagine synthase (glutamine-hydrolyzing) [Gemmatimonadaceae bacterium]